MSRHPPGILRVKSQPLHILRETPVARWHRRATNTRRRIRLCRATSTEEKLRRICRIKTGVLRISQHRFRGPGKGTAQYRLMNKIYAQAWRVPSRRVAYVIPHLIFLLVAQYRKCSNRCCKLVVAKSVQPRNRSKARTERKLQRKSYVVVARFG